MSVYDFSCDTFTSRWRCDVLNCTTSHPSALVKLLLLSRKTSEIYCVILLKYLNLIRQKRVVRIEQLPICPPTRHFPIYVSTFWPSVRKSWSVSKKLCRVLCRQAAFCVFYGLLLGLTSCVRTADACCLGCWLRTCIKNSPHPLFGSTA